MAVRALIVIATALSWLTSCGGDGEVSGEPSNGSVIPKERQRLLASLTEVQEEMKRALQNNGPSSEAFASTLDSLPKDSLWPLLAWLGSQEASEEQRTGLATVILSQLASKDPAVTANYLASFESPYNIVDSPATLMAFRQAMTQWSREHPEEAWEALVSFREDGELSAQMLTLTVMHGERLEVTLVGAMPLTDLKAIASRWNDLEWKEAGSLIPRLAQRTSSPGQRDALLEQSAQWLQQQWETHGPETVMQWGIGLGDEALQNEILSKIEPPEGSP